MFGVYFSPHQTSWEIVKLKQTFSLVSDTDVEISCFFNVKLKVLMNNF